MFQQGCLLRCGQTPGVNCRQLFTFKNWPGLSCSHTHIGTPADVQCSYTVVLGSSCQVWSKLFELLIAGIVYKFTNSQPRSPLQKWFSPLFLRCLCNLNQAAPWISSLKQPVITGTVCISGNLFSHTLICHLNEIFVSNLIDIG